jgi:hypothetical protein
MKIPVKVYEELKMWQITDKNIFYSEIIQWVEGTPYIVTFVSLVKNK